MLTITAECSASGAAARRDWLTAVDDAVELISRFPSAGRPMSSSAGSGHRELLVRGYRLIYRIDGLQLRIRALVHARQHFDASRLERLP